MTELTIITLDKLTAWSGNVRKTDSAAAINELAASIRAHGLLQSLVVQKHRGKFSVVAGRRRLLALRQLAEAGAIDADYPVPCHVLATDADASEISLVENTVREPMHPADEFEAFRDLADMGMQVADIAARFGVTSTVVEKRLKLARVSPAVLAAFRAGDISLEAVMAFTVVDDHAAQDEVLDGVRTGYHDDARDIRHALTEGEIPVTDKRVLFVTLAAYEAAGGGVRRDLFADDESGHYILDTKLLTRLVSETLDLSSDDLAAEGWKWIAVREDFDYGEWRECQRIYPEPGPLPEELAAEWARLEVDRDRLRDGDTDDDASADRFDAIDSRIDEIDALRDEVFTPEMRAIAGVVVRIDRKGGLDVRRGIVRPEDEPARIGAPEVDRGNDQTAAPALSAALMTDLTRQRSAALSAALARNPGVAFAAVVHALALRTFYGHRGSSCLAIHVAPRDFSALRGSRAFEALEEQRATWGDIFPGNADGLWSWCLQQNRETLTNLLAFCVASTVDVVIAKDGSRDAGRHAHGEDLADALSLDMGAWFTPTAENYFGRVSKPMILTALQEATCNATAPAWLKLKKSELAALAERQVAGTGWLPEPLRLVARADDSPRDALVVIDDEQAA